MNSSIWVVICAALLVGGITLGMWYSDYSSRRYWHEFGYCRTCDRLTCSSPVCSERQ